MSWSRSYSMRPSPAPPIYLPSTGLSRHRPGKTASSGRWARPAAGAGGGAGLGLGRDAVFDRDREAAPLAAFLGADSSDARYHRAAARGGLAPAGTGDRGEYR